MKLIEDDIKIFHRIVEGFENGQLTSVVIETRPPFDKEIKQQILEDQRLRELVEKNTDDISNYNSTKEFLQSLLDVSKETEESKA